MWSTMGTKERYSVPFFAEPNYNGDLLSGTTRNEGEPAHYGPLVDMRAKAKNFSDFPVGSLGN